MYSQPQPIRSSNSCISTLLDICCNCNNPQVAQSQPVSIYGPMPQAMPMPVAQPWPGPVVHQPQPYPVPSCPQPPPVACYGFGR